MLKTFYVCDRCGKELIQDHKKTYFSGARQFDCCDECFDIFMEYEKASSKLSKEFNKRQQELYEKYDINIIFGSDKE